MTSPMEAKTQLKFVEEKLGPDNSVFIVHKRGNLKTAIMLSMRRKELEKRRKFNKSIKRARQLLKENGEREEIKKPKPIDIKAEIESLLSKYK